jgi:hypothetical protein
MNSSTPTAQSSAGYAQMNTDTNQPGAEDVEMNGDTTRLAAEHDDMDVDMYEAALTLVSLAREAVLTIERNEMGGEPSNPAKARTPLPSVRIPLPSNRALSTGDEKMPGKKTRNAGLSVTCPVPGCHRVYVRPSYLKTHLIHHEKGTFKQRSDMPSNQPRKCNICLAVLSDAWKLRRHLANSSGGCPGEPLSNRFECGPCDLRFLRQQDLSRHNNTAHVQPKQSECEEGEVSAASGA